MVSAPHPYKSERTDIFVGIEQSQKEEVSVTRYVGFMREGQDLPDPEITWEEERVVGGNRDPYQHVEGQWAFEGGSWEVLPYDGFPIAWLLGSETVTADTPEAGITEHQITRKQDGPPPTATVEANMYGASGQSDFSRGFLSVVPSSGSIEQNNENELVVSLDNIALGLTPDTYDGTRTPTTGLSLPDREPWKFSQASSDLSMFGTSFARLEDFTLDVENNPTAEYYIESSESPEPYEVLYGNGSYELTVTLAVTDDTLWQQMLDTNTAFETNIGFTKETDDMLDITVTECRIPNAAHPIPDEGKVTTELSLTPRTSTITVNDSLSGGTGYLSSSTPV